MALKDDTPIAPELIVDVKEKNLHQVCLGHISYVIWHQHMSWLGAGLRRPPTGLGYVRLL